MPLCDHGDISLYYETHGSGPPLLLIAGLASDSQSWQPVIPFLAESFRVILVDNRGSGRSRPMDEFVSISRMADDCLLLLDYLEIPAAHVLGHSMGGFIAQELSLRHPQRVLSLVLAATACRNSSRNNALFADWAATRATADREQWFRGICYWLFTEHFYEDALQVSAAVVAAVDYPYPQSSTAFANQVRALAAFDRSNDLSKVTQPTLIISGSEDILFSPESATTLMRLLPAARTVTIRAAAHSICWEQPEACCRAVVAFLEEVQPLFGRGGHSCQDGDRLRSRCS